MILFSGRSRLKHHTIYGEGQYQYLILHGYELFIACKDIFLYVGILFSSHQGTRNKRQGHFEFVSDMRIVSEKNLTLSLGGNFFLCAYKSTGKEFAENFQNIIPEFGHSYN